MSTPSRPFPKVSHIQAGALVDAHADPAGLVVGTKTLTAATARRLVALGLANTVTDDADLRLRLTARGTEWCEERLRLLRAVVAADGAAAAGGAP